MDNEQNLRDHLAFMYRARQQAASVPRFVGSTPGLSFGQGSDMTGAVFGRARDRRIGSNEAPGLDAPGARIVGCCLSKSQFINSVVQDATFDGSSFENASMADSSFARSSFIGCEFIRARLSETDFEGACLDSVVFEGASFDDVGFEHASLRNADLRGADLSRCRIVDADFTGAEISGIRFRVDQLVDCPSLMQRVVEFYLESRASGWGSSAIEAVVATAPPMAPEVGRVRVIAERTD